MTKLNRSNCEEAFRRLDDYLDRELSSHEIRLIEEHLQICDWCAREFNFEASVLHGVQRKLRQIQVPPDLVARVLASLTREE